MLEETVVAASIRPLPTRFLNFVHGDGASDGGSSDGDESGGGADGKNETDHRGECTCGVWRMHLWRMAREGSVCAHTMQRVREERRGE